MSVVLVRQTCILGWEWACPLVMLCSRLPSDTCTRPPLMASPSPRARPLTSGWRSQTGRKEWRRSDLLLLLLSAVPCPPACSPGPGAFGCSCCTDPCTACRGVWPARPSQRCPAAARWETGWELSSDGAYPGHEGGWPERRKRRVDFLIVTTTWLMNLPHYIRGVKSSGSPLLREMDNRLEGWLILINLLLLFFPYLWFNGRSPVQLWHKTISFTSHSHYMYISWRSCRDAEGTAVEFFWHRPRPQHFKAWNNRRFLMRRRDIFQPCLWCWKQLY